MIPGPYPDILLSEEEFICFFLVYASHVDYDFSQKEKMFILERFDHSLFKKMEKLFLDNTDYGCLQIIMSHKRFYFNNKEQLDELLQHIHDIFSIDGDYSRIEKNFVTFFLKMIDTHSDES